MLITDWTGYGDEALDALDKAITRARGEDPLQPVTVVTPTTAVAVATRRALAARNGSIVGVGFHSMGALAEMIAAPELAARGIDVGVDRELVVSAVRAALAREPGMLGPIAHHRSTWETIARAVGDLAAAQPADLARLADRGGVPAEVRRVHEAVDAQVGSNGPQAVLAMAIDIAEAASHDTNGQGQARYRRIGHLGPVIVFLPDLMGGNETRLLHALSRSTDVTVLIGATGHPTVDAGFAGKLRGFDRPEPPDRAAMPATAVVSANDIDDEVRAAVRRLLDLADSGVPVHRMALVHPAGAPYARVVADVLRSTGVPFSGPSTKTLGETVAGRILARTMATIRSDFARPDVVDLWSTGVVVGSDGAPVPFAGFDERSRRFGTIRSAQHWREALDSDDQSLHERVAAGMDPDRADTRLDLNAKLRSSIDTLESLAALVPVQWADVAGWAGAVIDALCGPRARRSWPDHEITAEDALRTALGRLSALTQVEAAPPLALIFETIETVLDTPAPREATTGTGLVVTTIDSPPLVPLDAVAVIGLVEGHTPRVAREDVLLGDDARAALGLPTSNDIYDRQHRAFHAALASARHHRLITFARHDQRSGRSLVPSRWLIDAIEERSGQRHDAEALMSGEPLPGIEVVASFGHGLATVDDGATTALHARERALASMVASGGMDGHPGMDQQLHAGTVLIRSRASHTFTRFDGNVGEGPDISGLGALSPTSLETYATCPRKWFFEHELKLRPVDRPEEVDAIKPSARGSLIHRALELFFSEAIDTDAVPPPGIDWSADARQRMREIGEDVCRYFERLVPTGHPRRWAHDRSAILRTLDSALDGDTMLRAHFGVTPVAVEFTFGRNGEPPLEIDLGDGRVIALSGQADRVDAGDGRAVVWDYKVAKSDRWEVLRKDEGKDGDKLGFGAKLQLVAYGMAASDLRGAGGAGGDVHASYWFLASGAKHMNRPIGYDVTVELKTRFRDVLRVLADGIGAGRFPARPGEYQWHWGTFEHCGFCEFGEICPADRDEEWERVRFDPTLRPLRTLVEDGSHQLSASGSDEP